MSLYSFVCVKGKVKRPHGTIASVERPMYYNNSTTQHSLIRDEIIDNERYYNSLQCLTE